MKTIFLLFLAFSAFISSDPTLGDFFLEDQKVVYRKVFENDQFNDQDQLVQQLIIKLTSTPGLHNVQDLGASITADIDGLVIDYRKHGGKQVFLPMMYLDGMRGKLRIDIKDGRYRVVVSNMEFYDYQKVQTLEYLLLTKRNTEFKTAKNWAEVVKYLDLQFIDTFTIKADTSDNW